MTGIFYDPQSRRIRRVTERADPSWSFVTHNLGAGEHHCRRIMREWLGVDELFLVDWSAIQAPRTRSA